VCSLPVNDKSDRLTKSSFCQRQTVCDWNSHLCHCSRSSATRLPLPETPPLRREPESQLIFRVPYDLAKLAHVGWSLVVLLTATRRPALKTHQSRRRIISPTPDTQICSGALLPWDKVFRLPVIAVALAITSSLAAEQITTNSSTICFSTSPVHRKQQPTSTLRLCGKTQRGAIQRLSLILAYAVTSERSTEGLRRSGQMVAQGGSPSTFAPNIT